MNSENGVGLQVKSATTVLKRRYIYRTPETMGFTQSASIPSIIGRNSFKGRLGSQTCTTTVRLVQREMNSQFSSMRQLVRNRILLNWEAMITYQLIFNEVS